MQPRQTSTSKPTMPEQTEKLFTVAEANRALVLVGRIVSDIVRQYRELLTLRDERHELAHTAGNAERLEQIDQQIEQSMDLLNSEQTELLEIGCELKDWTNGLVDFPALHQGHKVWLCWRLGETAVTHWHKLDAGFAGRKPLDS